MPKTRRHGQGSIEWIGKDGYLWARGRLRYRGDLWLTEGVGAGSTTLDRLTGPARATIEREIECRLERLYAGLAVGRRPERERERERRPLRRQLDLWLAATGPRMRPRSRRAYLVSVEQHIEPFPIAGLELGALGPDDVARWLAALERAGATSYQRRAALTRLVECLRALRADGFGGQGVAAIVDAASQRRRPVPSG